MYSIHNGDSEFCKERCDLFVESKSLMLIGGRAHHQKIAALLRQVTFPAFSRNLADYAACIFSHESASSQFKALRLDLQVLRVAGGGETLAAATYAKMGLNTKPGEETIT